MLNLWEIISDECMFTFYASIGTNFDTVCFEFRKFIAKLLSYLEKK